MNQQAAEWPACPCLGSRGGFSSTHLHMTRATCPAVWILIVSPSPDSAAFCRVSGQRGWNGQPVGGLDGRGHFALAARSGASSAAGWARERPTAATSCTDASDCVYSSSARRLLDDPAEVHHRDVVGEMLDDRQVVRDEQVRDVPLLLQIIEQIEDLRLDRNVQRARPARRRR